LVSSRSVLSRLERPIVARRVALGILVVTLFGLLAYAVMTRGIPWTRECDANPSCHVLAGESLVALESALYFRQPDRASHWLLQREEESGEVLTYIHNVNLGAFLVHGTVLLGAQSPLPAAVVSAIAFVAGLAYGYLYVERASGSRRFALLFLALFAGELYHNTLHGLNLLRAWHWLPLFGLAYHALVIAQRRTVRVGDALALIALAIVGFGTGYELYAFVGAVAAWTMLLFGAGFRPRLWGMLAVALAIPVVLRQIQVIGGVGWTIWSTDLYYTAGLKSPLLRSILSLPPAEEMALWYRENGLFRGTTASGPSLDALALLVSSGRHLQWLDELGALTLLVTLVGLVLAIVLVLRHRGAGPGTPARRGLTVVCLFLGLGTGFLVFGYHALYYFVVVHQLPLIVAPVCLAVAFFLSLLLDAAAGPLAVRVAAYTGIGLLIGERLYKQWANVHEMGLRAHPDTTRWGFFVVGPPGGLYGPNGTIVLGVAGLVLLAVLCYAAFAFLRPDAVDGFKTD
jgi:hypothetical protein